MEPVFAMAPAWAKGGVPRTPLAPPSSVAGAMPKARRETTINPSEARAVGPLEPECNLHDCVDVLFGLRRPTVPHRPRAALHL